METILRIQDLVKTYQANTVLHGITVDIHQGEIFGLIGSSGSGKTTLLNTLIGFVRPTSGQVLFRNPHLLDFSDKETGALRNVLLSPKDVKVVFGFAAQKPSVYPKLTLQENLELFGSMYGLSKDAVASNTKILLKLMEIYDAKDYLAEQLSGGMLKRLDIACALIHDPKILILDEPTADLDPYHRTHMWELIRRIHAKGTTIILSSHFLDELEDLCDRIGIIYKGRMDHIGTSHELKKTLVPHEKIHIETKKKKYKEIEEILVKKQSVHKWKHIEITEHELILTVDSAVPFVMDLPEYVKSLDDEIIDIQIVKPTLTEVFSHIMNQSPDKHVLDEIVNTQSPDQAKTKKKRKNK